MESQGQPCFKGLPSTQLGAQVCTHQHEQNDDMDGYVHKEKRAKHILPFDDLSPQCKKQKEDIDDKSCSSNSSINDNRNHAENKRENEKSKENCFSEINEISENTPQEKVVADENSILTSHYVVTSGISEKTKNLNNECVEEMPCPMSHQPEEPAKLALISERDSQDTIGKDLENLPSETKVLLPSQEETEERIQTVEYIPEEKTLIACTSKNGLLDDMSNDLACNNERSIDSTNGQDIRQNSIQPSDRQVQNENEHLEGIPSAVTSLGADSQESHYVVSSPTDQHLPAEFHSQRNPEENIKIHVGYDYNDISSSHKAIDSYHSGEVNQAEAEQHKRFPLKLDLEHLQLLNVGGTVEYMESLPSIVAVKSTDASAITSHNDAAKGDQQTSSQDTIIVRSNDQKTSDIDSVPIQVYPQTQGISLVTSSGILTADISTFSTQVPAILTEGDADDTEAAASFAEQFHVVTTSAALPGSSQIQVQTPGNEMLSVMMSSGDFTKGVILTPDQQQALLGEVIAPGGHAQTLHITIPNVTTELPRPLVSASISEGTGGGSHGTKTEDQASASRGNKTLKLQVISNNEDESNKDVESEGDKVHLCPHPNCNKVCHRAHKLKLHMLSHTGERPYKCSHDGCEWAFTTAYKLKRHERGHTGERPFVCPHGECSRRFTTAYNLKTHIRAHNRTNTILCSYEGCDKTFPTLHKFRVHERKHQQDEKPFKCEVDGCGKEFSAMGTLTSHLKSHSGERPHGCPVDGCCKRFTKASKLKLHLRTHTGERPFCCDFEGCGWSFTSAYKLKRHRRKHTGERPYLCMYEGCHKSFTRSSHLKTHTLVHTGEKPYVCPMDGCNKAFTAGSSLNVHMRKHTGEKPFRCEADGCSKAYTTASNLRAHQKRHEKSTKQVTEGSEDHPVPADFVTVSTMSSVSSAGSLVENDGEVTYTSIHTFPSEDFTTDDVTSLPVSVHFPSGSLSAIVTNRGNSLSFSTACSSSSEHADVSDEQGGQSIQSDIESKGVATVTLPAHLGNTVDGSHIDVAEFVVRSDNAEPALHTQDTSRHSDADNLKHDGGFDLSISSMVSHLRSHETSPNKKLVSSEVLAAQGHASERLVIDNKFVPAHSRSLEFRTPLNPEDQFKPPAVIFQDDCSKSGSSDTEGDSTQQCTVLPTTNQNLMQITLPQDVIQVHFPQQTDSPLPPENDNPIDVGVNTSHQLQSYEGTALSSLQDHSLNKSDLSPYIDDEECSPEPDDGNVDSYPESTINLQDLR